MKPGRYISLFMLMVCVLISDVIKAESSLKARHPLVTYWKMTKIDNPVELQISLKENIRVYMEEGLIEPVILFELMLAESYEGYGNYIEAEKRFINAYELSIDNLPERKGKYYLIGRTTQVTIFDSIDKLAFFYLTIGNVVRSEQLFLESKELRNNFFKLRSVHRIYPVIGLGSLHYRKGDYIRTFEYFSLANNLLEKTTTTGYDLDILNRLFLNDLVELSMRLHKNDEALKYINKLSIASSGKGKYNTKIARDLELARIFELKARFAISENDFNSANQYLQKANHYYPESIPISDVLLKILKSEGLLNWYSGNYDNADKAFQNLVFKYREHINQNFISMSEYEKEQFYYLLKNDFNLFNAFVLDSRTLYGELYNNILNTKAILLNSTNKIKNRIISSNNEDMIQKLEEWERLKSNLSELYYQRDVEAELDAMKETIANLEREINRFSGMFETRENPPTWQSVLGNLKNGEGAVEIVRVNVFDKDDPTKINVNNGLTDSTVYMILLLKPGVVEPEVVVLENGNDLEDKYLTFYRNSIMYSATDNTTYKQYWLPIESKLNRINRLYCSPDGVFNQLNLNTLRNPNTKKYLIDEIELIMLTNTSDLLKLREANQVQSAVLVGRPLFDLDDQNKTQFEIPVNNYGFRNSAIRELVNFIDQEFEDLPGTEREILQIGTLLKSRGYEVTPFLGSNALEENIKKVQSPGILHIATHGFFLDQASSIVSPMILSGVVLAGVVSGKTNKVNDGILTAYEATNLDLDRTDIVVLSACQTGIGEIRNGEGVYGLQRGIIVAGTKNLLMSLWKVDDEATAQLMINFYQFRHGRSNQEAFRLAQIELRKQYTHPFYWGAFIMLGN